VRQIMLQISSSLHEIRHFCFDANPYPTGRRGLRRNRNVWRAASSDLSHYKLEFTSPNTGASLRPCATSPREALNKSKFWLFDICRRQFALGGAKIAYGVAEGDIIPRRFQRFGWSFSPPRRPSRLFFTLWPCGSR
jgi:hypothetical protein